MEKEQNPAIANERWSDINERETVTFFHKQEY